MKGLEYFRNLVFKEDNAKSLFYYAWSLYECGDLEIARKYAEIILAKLSPDAFYSGHAYYLIGNITGLEGKLSESIDAFTRANRIYSLHEKYGSLFKSHCGIAKTLIFQGDLEMANESLMNAMDAHTAHSYRAKKPKNLGYYYELLSRVEFRKGRYANALEHLENALSEHGEDFVRATRVLSGIAFYKLLLGQIDGGLADTKLVDLRLNEDPSQFPKTSYHNGVNWLIIKKCSQDEYQDIENGIREYITASNDWMLEWTLRFAIAFDCNQEEL